MKILILIQGTFDKTYSDIEHVVRSTWYNDLGSDSMYAKFYYGAFDNENNLISESGVDIKKEQVIENSNGDIIVGCFDLLGNHFDPRGEKFIRSLEYVYNSYEFDYILRVSNTSYIIPEKLEQYIENIPMHNFYDGARNLYNYKYFFVSGHNSLMSKDCVRKLIEIKEDFLNCRYLEDVAVGYFLMHKLKYTSWSENNIDDNFIPTHILAYLDDFHPENYRNNIAYNYKFRFDLSKKMFNFHTYLKSKY